MLLHLSLRLASVISGVASFVDYILLVQLSNSCTLVSLMVKVDKTYVSTPTKIAIIDHERKRTFVLRKDGLPDAGEFSRINILPYVHVDRDKFDMRW